MLFVDAIIVLATLTLLCIVRYKPQGLLSLRAHVGAAKP
jgi:hypothetical protein